MRKVKMRRFIEASLLLAIGFVLHSIMPPLILGMRPDLSLIMLFVVVMLYRDLRLTLVSGAVSGIISAFTTTFPGGQLANVVEKPLTSLLVLGILYLVSRTKISSKLEAGIVGLIGTIISGTLFLLIALLFVGLPGSFKALFLSVVLPAALMNVVFIYILYPIIKRIKGLTPSTKRELNEASNKAA
ncbi:tryptophan transporter [Sporohalobacter salinus]|uniref:tryptophan transporter n=1 Tax=Sporohalobacter salinus TaxID=1494606 RepID=UPI001EF8825E|nr:tryptophan transporter [Sporohalobacter salinus]MBM7624905.1 riboflavin transporter FmnP [Sporohalobacter salinus]